MPQQPTTQSMLTLIHLERTILSLATLSTAHEEVEGNYSIVIISHIDFSIFKSNNTFEAKLRTCEGTSYDQ